MVVKGGGNPNHDPRGRFAAGGARHQRLNHLKETYEAIGRVEGWNSPEAVAAERKMLALQHALGAVKFDGVIIKSNPHHEPAGSPTGGQFTSGGGGLQSIASHTQGTVDISSWKKVGGQGGSNPGGVFQSPQGDKWYVKTPSFKGVPQPDIAKNEAMGNALYKLAGVRVPEMQLVNLNGNLSVASKIAPGIELGKLNSADRASAIDKAKPGFAADAWLGGYDVAGYSDDNMLYDKASGNLTRIDQGGTLTRRAQGKPREFGPEATYFDSLRDPDHSSHQSDMDVHLAGQTTGVFGNMTPEELKASADSVTSISGEKIAAVVHQFGGDDKLVDTLVSRQKDIARRTNGLVVKEEGFDEAKHPRAPAGTSAGGQFTAGGGGASDKPGVIVGNTMVLDQSVQSIAQKLGTWRLQKETMTGYHVYGDGGIDSYPKSNYSADFSAGPKGETMVTIYALNADAKYEYEYLHGGLKAKPVQSIAKYPPLESTPHGDYVAMVTGVHEEGNKIKANYFGQPVEYDKATHMVLSSTGAQGLADKHYVYTKAAAYPQVLDTPHGKWVGQITDLTDDKDTFHGNVLGEGKTFGKNFYMLLNDSQGQTHVYANSVGGTGAHQAAIASVSTSTEMTLHPGLADPKTYGAYVDSGLVKETTTDYTLHPESTYMSAVYPKDKYIAIMSPWQDKDAKFPTMEIHELPPKVIEAPLKAATPEQTTALYAQWKKFAPEGSGGLASHTLGMTPAITDGKTVISMSDKSKVSGDSVEKFIPGKSSWSSEDQDSFGIVEDGTFHSNKAWSDASDEFEASMKKGDYVDFDDRSSDAYDYVKENGVDNLKPALTNGYAVYTGDEGSSHSNGLVHDKVNKAGWTAAEHDAMKLGWVDSDDNYYSQSSIHDAQYQVEQDQLEADEEQQREEDRDQYSSVATLEGGLSSFERETLNDYAGAGNGPMNQTIRDPNFAAENGWDVKRINKKIDAIREVFARSTLDSGETFTRGTGGYKDSEESKKSGWGKLIADAQKNGAESLVGQTIIKPHFQSFSKDTSQSDNFSSGVNITLNVPAGTPAIDMEDLGVGLEGEREVLLPYGSYKVTRARLVGSSNLRIEADFIPSKTGFMLDPPKSVDTSQFGLPLNEPEQHRSSSNILYPDPLKYHGEKVDSGLVKETATHYIVEDQEYPKTQYTAVPADGGMDIHKKPKRKSASAMAKASVRKPAKFDEDWSDWDHPIMSNDIYSIAAFKL